MSNRKDLQRCKPSKNVEDLVIAISQFYFHSS